MFLGNDLMLSIDNVFFVLIILSKNPKFHILIKNELFTPGSAASLNESSSCSKISNPPTSIDSNESVAGSSTSQRDKDADLNGRRLGMESDVEILSNPSQSSIEVLNRSVIFSKSH